MSFTENRRPSPWVEIGVLAVILVVAAFLRLVQLDAVPPGMTHDEAAFGAEAEKILAGEYPIYFAIGYGHEPLYAYLVALVFALFGRTLIAIRITSAVCGLLVVLGTYLLARRMFGFNSAWISAAWVAVAFWPLSLSRQALRAVTLPMLWLPAAWWFWRGLHVAGCGALRLTCHASRSASQAEPEIAQHPARWTWNRAASSSLDLKSRSIQLAGPATWNFALSGLFLGMTFYTYMASRVTWVVFPLFALYLLLRQETRAALKRVWPGVAIVLAVTGLVALPLVLYLRAHPAAEIRVDVMMEPVRELLAGKPQRVLRHVWNALRVFSWVGDRFWAYNISGRPVFNWVGSLLFYAGLVLALWRWRDPRYAFLLLWLGVGLAPAMVTTNEGIFLRAIVAQPVTYVLVAEALRGIGPKFGIALQGTGSKLKPANHASSQSILARRAEARGASSEGRIAHHASRFTFHVSWIALVVGLLAVEGVRTYRAYFVDWPGRPEARNIYNHNLVATARYLRDEPESGAVGISALYPLYYHDPWIVRYLAGHDGALRWFDGRGCIVYPADGEARYVFSALTPLDPALGVEFASQAKLIDRRELASDDENPTFEIWRWQGGDALRAGLNALASDSEMWLSPEVQFNRPELRQALDDPAQFGDVMALIGYSLNSTAFQPGDVVELITYWRALRTVHAQDDWVTFVHLLDESSQGIGGVDVLHCPPTGWLPGDTAVQVHRFEIGDHAPRNKDAYLEVGVYRRSSDRLPVMIDGEPVSDRVLLSPIDVR